VVVTDMVPFTHLLDIGQLYKSGAKGRPGPNLLLELQIFVLDILFLNYFLFLDVILETFAILHILYCSYFHDTYKTTYVIINKK
jgi:hypothetical protein